MPERKSTTAPKAESKKENLLLRARAAATTRLIDENTDRFHVLYSEEAQSLGVTYTPPLTPAQKREQQLRALLEEDPSLREKILAEQNVTSEPIA